MKWFLKCIKNYVNFAGRARRKEFWFFNLFAFIFTFVAGLLDWTLLGRENAFLQALVNLFLFLPSLAVSVRRLHDTGRSGVNMLLYLIFSLLALVVSFVVLLSAGLLAYGAAKSMSLGLTVFFGATFAVWFGWAVVLIVWFCIDGTKGDNKYGPDPKEIQE